MLVGLATPDDAAVFKLSDEQAVVLTVDFFAPLVDDPYSYGAIAAANAMSDVYAMGAEVTLALNIAAFPEDMSTDVISRILQGGMDKVTEAGGIIAGGHTIIDREPKYGLCVLGLVHPEQVLTKAGARPGDLLYLTKPLGTGIITTAAQQDRASSSHLKAAVESMTRLNRHPSHIVREAGGHALTDVTGYSLLGHAHEMAQAGAVHLTFDASRMPVLPGALEYAREGISTGGAARNRSYLKDRVLFSRDVPDDLADVLYDPQTSGGLLFALAPENATDAEGSFGAAGLEVWQVGKVSEGAGVEVVS